MDLMAILMANKKKKIYHRNDARPSLARMELPARRILYLCIVQQEREAGGNIIFDKDRLYVITAQEYAALCNIDASVAYKQLKEGIKNIRGHMMEVPESEINSDRDSSKNDRMILFTVANYGVYSDGEGYVELKLDPIIAPYISKLKSNFTGQFLLSALRLPDSNANKLYLLLREWISSGMSIHKDIEVDELKSKLFVSDVKTYGLFNDFNNLFFKRAVKKIIEVTEFSKIDMVIIERRKRKAYKVRISYEYSDQKKHFKDAGFMAGINKKSKKDKFLKENDKENVDAEKSQELSSDDLKQINGRFYDKKTAESSGYNWDEY